MLTLLIDTSTERGVVAITHRDGILFHADLPFGLNSQQLMPLIHQGLSELNLSVKQFVRIGVAIGPGSYTGIRVGAMVATTLAFPHQLPVVGICSLRGFVPSSEGIFATLIDAKISGAYFAKGIKKAQSVQHQTETVYPIELLEEQLKGISVIVTPNKARLQPIMEPFYKGIWEEKKPCIETLNRIVDEQFNAGNYSVNGHLDLLYMR